MITLAIGSRKEFLFSADNWVSRAEALDQAEAILGSLDLAVHDLMQHVRKGQVATAVRRVGSDGSDIFESLEPSFWEGAGFSRALDDFVFPGNRYVDGAQRWFFFAREDLNKLYPVVPANMGTPTRAKPGPKPREDWHTKVAAWLISVALDNPKKLQNVDALAAEASDFLLQKVKWAPKDQKELRRKIVELLQFVPR